MNTGGSGTVNAVQPRIIALHGFTMSGAELQRQLGVLAGRLSTHAGLHCPDAPHTCSAASVARMSAAAPTRRPPTPALMWWSASDDGSVYDGFEQSLEQLRGLLAEGPPALLLGFSQGAIFTAVLAALSSLGQLPRIAGAVLIAGAVPRAPELKRLFDREIAVPSLHIVGDRDRLMGSKPEQLAQHFGTTCLPFGGGHAIPTRGPAADAIVEFSASLLG